MPNQIVLVLGLLSCGALASTHHGGFDPTCFAKHREYGPQTIYHFNNLDNFTHIDQELQHEYQVRNMTLCHNSAGFISGIAMTLDRNNSYYYNKENHHLNDPMTYEFVGAHGSSCEEWTVPLGEFIMKAHVQYSAIGVS